MGAANFRGKIVGDAPLGVPLPGSADNSGRPRAASLTGVSHANLLHTNNIRNDPRAPTGQLKS